MHVYEVGNRTACPDNNDINHRRNVNGDNYVNYFNRRMQEIQSPSPLCEPPQLMLSSMSRMSSICGCGNNKNSNNNNTTSNITNTTTAGSSSSSSNSMCGLSPSPVQTNAHILSYVNYSRPLSLCINSPYQSNSPYPNLFFNKEDKGNNSNNNNSKVSVNSLNITKTEESLPVDIENAKKLNTLSQNKQECRFSPHTHFNCELNLPSKSQHVCKGASREICHGKVLNTMGNSQSTMENESKSKFMEVEERKKGKDKHQEHNLNQGEQQYNVPLYSRVNVFDNDVNAEIDVHKHFKFNSYKNMTDRKAINDHKHNKHNHHLHWHRHQQEEQHQENYNSCISKEQETAKRLLSNSAVLDEVYNEPETSSLIQSELDDKINNNNAFMLHKSVKGAQTKHNFSSRCGVTVEPISHFTHRRQGPFCCGKLLGRGGYAEVYEFINLTSHVTYACKVIERSKLNTKSERDFWQEVHIHRSLHHKHIVELIDCCSDQYYYYVLLERCRSKTLMDIAAERRTFTEEEARQVMVQVLDGVAYLHACHIVHCDLKLSNILFDYGGMVKIADFGFAYSLTNSHTPIRRICGTPNYIAPEVLQCHHSTCGYSAKVDVWSLGVVLFILVCGYAPFQSHNLDATYKRITNNEYYFPCEMSRVKADNGNTEYGCKYGCRNRKRSSSSSTIKNDNVSGTNIKHVISASCKALIRQLLHQDPSMRPTIEEIQTSHFMSLPSDLLLSSTRHINRLRECNNTTQSVMCKSVALVNLVENEKKSALTKRYAEEKECLENNANWQRKTSKERNSKNEKGYLNKCNSKSTRDINFISNMMHTLPHCAKTESFNDDNNISEQRSNQYIYESRICVSNTNITTEEYSKRFPSESLAYKINEEEQRQIAERVNMLLKGWITRQDVFAACKTTVREHRQITVDLLFFYN